MTHEIDELRKKLDRANDPRLEAKEKTVLEQAVEVDFSQIPKNNDLFCMLNEIACSITDPFNRRKDAGEIIARAVTYSHDVGQLELAKTTAEVFKRTPHLPETGMLIEKRCVWCEHSILG